MLYLEKFLFPGEEAEHAFFMGQKLNCYTSYYPFQILAPRGFRRMDFEPITILSGSNGSGKSTALSVIAEKLRLTRNSAFNQTSFYPAYVDLCVDYRSKATPSQSRILTSDDVFDYMLDMRNINQNIDTHREGVFEEYFTLKKSGKYSDFTMKTMDDYDTVKKLLRARSVTVSKFTRETLPANVRTHSNGETALRFFTEKIKDGGLYLLDEPENSLSPGKQRELAAFLEESARFFDCQFIISTHSVFLLGIRNAKIYDLDENPVDVKPWIELAVSRAYYDFFRERSDEFE